MDKQFAFAVILILLGFGLRQFGRDDPFLSGLGLGTIGMASVWIAIRIIREIRASRGKGGRS